MIAGPIGPPRLPRSVQPAGVTPVKAGMPAVGSTAAVVRYRCPATVPFVPSPRIV